MSAGILDRIRSRCTDDAGCWVWDGHCNRGVFPVMSVKGKPASTRRVAWEAVNGPVPPGFEIVAGCATFKCVNPACAEKVTKRARRILMAAQRDKSSTAKATAKIRAKAKLSMEIAREIRASDLPNTVLAERYGVVHQVVSMVRLNKAWVEATPWTGLGAR